MIEEAQVVELFRFRAELRCGEPLPMGNERYYTAEIGKVQEPAQDAVPLAAVAAERSEQRRRRRSARPPNPPPLAVAATPPSPDRRPRSAVSGRAGRRGVRIRARLPVGLVCNGHLHKVFFTLRGITLL